MKRLATLALVCVCLLAPATARADDGGWLDWLFRLDPKFVGVATDIHLRCLDRNNNTIPCEEFYKLRQLLGGRREAIEFRKIQHEFNLRVAYYHTYGDLFDANTSDSANAIKIMGFYAYHPDDHITVGAGAGFLPFFGGDTIETRWSGIVTPMSVRYAPRRDGILGKAFFVHGEASWIADPPTIDLFANSASRAPAAHRGEWNASIGIGFDFRQVY